ncbi:hypothetical protein [Nocardia sp. BMG51109]|uniref:hypothetical protein n=1 Tax=Nocardia sp. BMG51109 TaxID=1056816 RepID=UPI0012EB6E04|nr:hypothetical protein [Nocardia sp. BMG51109]
MTPPTASELIDAMLGILPGQHAAQDVLSAAFALANLRDWFTPDDLFTLSGDPGSEILDRLGLGDGWMRAQLAARIDEAAPQVPGIGDAVTAFAMAWRTWHYHTNSCDMTDDSPEARDLIRTRAAYTNLTAATAET